MKFECKECRTPCKLDWGDSELYKPTECPAGLKEANWREVAEPVALPKLTAEVQDENRFVLDGVEYEAVAAKSFSSSDTCAHCVFPGKCGQFKKPPCTYCHRKDNRNVYFRKVKQLPDWLKVGAWAAVGNFVGKIDWISRDASECRITCGESRFAKNGEAKAVTWREWTFEEAPEAVKCTVNGIHRVARLTMLAKKGNPVYGYRITCGASFAPMEWMLKYATQLSGLPCGVPQVDGADLEG